MADRDHERQAPATGKLTQGPWGPVLMVLLAASAFVAGWRSRRGWGRLTGY